jgi:GNAT superfamily N-acetyltransferase
VVAIDARMFCYPIHTGIGQVAVRPIMPCDAELLQEFVSNLSGTSRYSRFFQHLKCLSPTMLERFTCIDYSTQMALVATRCIRGKMGVIGETRYCGTGDGVTAEIAVVVADAWRRRGVGAGLLRILERIAAANGIARLTGEAFAGNDEFRSFAQACGFATRSAADPSYLRFEKGIDAVGTLRSTDGTARVSSAEASIDVLRGATRALSKFRVLPREERARSRACPSSSADAPTAYPHASTTIPAWYSCRDRPTGRKAQHPSCAHAL